MKTETVLFLVVVGLFFILPKAGHGSPGLLPAAPYPASVKVQKGPEAAGRQWVAIPASWTVPQAVVR